MELCTGGSLFNILDDPINCYGLEEKEFVAVLKHLGNHLCCLSFSFVCLLFFSIFFNKFDSHDYTTKTFSLSQI